MRLFRWVREVCGHANYETFPVFWTGTDRNYETFPVDVLPLWHGHRAWRAVRSGSVSNYETFPGMPLWPNYETFPVPVPGRCHAYGGACCAGGNMRGRGGHQL